MARFPYLYGWITFHCVCVCVYAQHISFTHSSAERHLDNFHILASVINATMKTGLLILLQQADRHEQRRGTQGQMTGNHASCKQQDPRADKEKQEPPD